MEKAKKPKRQYRSIKKPAAIGNITLAEAENAAKKIKAKKNVKKNKKD